MEGQRKGLMLAVLLLAGCEMDWKHDHERDSFGREDTDPDAPPSTSEIRARILNDARSWRMLREKAEEEGRADCREIRFVDGGPICAKDEEKLVVFQFPGDSPDKPYRVEETAYYCGEESVYYYHYVGGRDRLDVWMGPYKVTWNRGGK